jgi:hypothetical protein
MAKQQMQLAIPEPCHENWNAMSPQQQGRFCGVCTKTVVDFSNMSDGQVMETIQKASGGLCGHFHTDQINRTLVAAPRPKWWMQPFWQYIVGGILLLKPGTIKAQKSGTEQCTPQPPHPRLMGKPKIMGKIAMPVENKDGKIRIRIVSETGEAIDRASVIVTNKVTGISNSKGIFEADVSRGDELMISALGFESQRVVVNRVVNMQVVMKQHVKEPQMLMGIVAIAPREYNVHYTVKDATDSSAVKSASVVIKKARQTAVENRVTDKKGRFNATAGLYPGDELIISIIAEGYEPQTVKLTQQQLNNNGLNQVIYLKQIAVEKTVFLMGDTMAIAPFQQTNPVDTVAAKPTLFSGLTKAIKEALAGMSKSVTPVQPETQKNKAAAPAASIKIQPNPAQRGTPVSIHIQAGTSETMMLQVTEADGKILHQQKTMVNKGGNIVSVLTKEAWGSKIVLVRLMNSKGQWVGSAQLVVQ